MDPQLLISMVGGIGFAFGAAASYLGRQDPNRWRSTLLRMGALIAICAIIVYLGGSVRESGMVETFQQNHRATLLLAALIGLTGWGTGMSTSLRGLDGFLFGMAAMVGFASIVVIGRPVAGVPFKSWFISHGIAFAMSGACFVTAGAAGTAYLLAHRRLRRKEVVILLGTLPPLEALERFVRWAILIGFPLFTYGVLTGICELVRTHNPGPAAWLRDPLIALSFVAWFAYALIVMAMLFLPWIRGRRIAAVAMGGMGLIVVIFLVIELVSPLHR